MIGGIKQSEDFELQEGYPFYIGCNFFMTLLTRKLGMCIIKICKENLAWRCFYEKG